MFRNSDHKGLQFSVAFILLLILMACNSKTENKKNQSAQNDTSMNMDMNMAGMDMPQTAMDSNTAVSDTLNFVIKPTNEYVRSGVALATLQSSEEEIEVEALGNVVYDTRQVGSVSARLSGRIEKLYVRYRYQKINAGQKIMDLYSPEISTTEQDLLFLLKNDADNASLINSAKQKLLLLGMSEEQLNKIILTQQPDFTIGIYSKYSGHIHEAGALMSNSEQPEAMRDVSLVTEELSLKEGMYVQKGQTILTVYNPNHAWAMLNFYSDKQAIIHKGSPVRIVPETAPNKDFRAKVDFIEPFYRKENKTVTARVYFDNSQLKIPIGSQVRATIFGNTQTANWLPETAIVSLGLDKVVFIKHDIGFKAHKITTGITYKNKIQVLEGLTAKDTVAANGQYLMDSESFIKVN